MAVTYFAITSGEAGNLDLPEAVGVKLRGEIRCWYADTGTATEKWVVVGDDILAGDSARLRSITTQRRSAIVNELTRMFGLSHAAIANYGRALNRTFRIDLRLDRALVDAL